MKMPHASARELDLRTAAPFGISRWTHSEFADYVVELRAGEHVGRGEAAPNRRYGESREEGMAVLADLAPEIADLEGPAGVEALCDVLAGEAGAAPAWPALRAGLSAAAWDLAGLAHARPGAPVGAHLVHDRHRRAPAQASPQARRWRSCTRCAPTGAPGRACARPARRPACRRGPKRRRSGRPAGPAMPAPPRPRRPARRTAPPRRPAPPGRRSQGQGRRARPCPPPATRRSGGWARPRRGPRARRPCP